MCLMIWLYRILYLPALLLALPYYGFRMWKRGGYSKDFKHRLGFFHKLSKPTADKKRIWLQAVSVGEIRAIGPLMDALSSDGDVEIVLTTTTSTGYEEALKLYPQKTLQIGLFPLDFWPCNQLAWKRIQPDTILLTESELWPEHLHRANAKDVPLFLINARISDKSFRNYKKVVFLARWLLRKFDFIYATNDRHETRLLELGANAEAIRSTGNIKFDVAIGRQSLETDLSDLYQELGFTTGPEEAKPFILLGSSTWPGEEQALLEVQTELIEKGVDCRLLLVPRHKERGPEIVSLLKKQSLPWHQRSTGQPVSDKVCIYLADTTGELTRLTQVGDLAFIGKSLPPNEGGQTPIEAAGIGVPVVMGPNMSNFTEVVRSLTRSSAARVVNDVPQLKAAIHELFGEPELRESMSKAGVAWHKQNRGSSQRIAEDLKRNWKPEAGG